jgi:N6-adenosine-specific RNA methylase IME4
MKIVRLPGGREQQIDLFDERPIKLEGFTLRARRAEAVGKPTIAQWTAAFQFATAAEESSPFWVGDLWVYAEERPDWREELSQALADVGRPLSDKTLSNLGYVSRHVSDDARALAPTISHAGEVASLEPEEQVTFLDKAKTEGWTSRDLRLHVRQAKRPAIISGQAALEGMFRIIYADPAWDYGDRPPSGVGQEEHYPSMSIEELCALPVPEHVMPNAMLAMWTTAPTILQNPGPRDVGEAWGFDYKQQIIWDKVDPNFGHYTSGNHEILTIWTRGSCLPDLPTDLPDSVQVIRKTRRHSEKPEEFRRLIEKHWTHGPYLELFGRKKHEGWTVFGNDARLWARDAERQAS